MKIGKGSLDLDKKLLTAYRVSVDRYNYLCRLPKMSPRRRLGKWKLLGTVLALVFSRLLILIQMPIYIVTCLLSHTNRLGGTER